MSSYLNIYLVPKRKDKKDKKQYLVFTSYSRNSDIYKAFHENLNVAFIGNEIKYTTLDKVSIQTVLDDVGNDMKHAKERLQLYEKYAKDNTEYIEEILTYKEIVEEYEATYNFVRFLMDIVSDIVDGYNDFEEVCCNMD